MSRLEARAEAIERELDRVCGDLAALESEDRLLAGREEDLARQLSSSRESLERNAGQSAVATADLARAGRRSRLSTRVFPRRGRAQRLDRPALLA